MFLFVFFFVFWAPVSAALCCLCVLLTHCFFILVSFIVICIFVSQINSSLSLSLGIILSRAALSVARRQSTPQVDFSDNPVSQPSFAFYDARLLEQVRQGDAHIHQFFRLLALCHTVMPEEKNGAFPRSACWSKSRITSTDKADVDACFTL